jgi:hypothetical protein
LDPNFQPNEIATVQSTESSSSALRNEEEINEKPDVVVETEHKLKSNQVKSLHKIIQKFKTVTRDKLERTNVLQHHIDVGNARPIHSKPYIYTRRQWKKRYTKK